MGAMSYYTSISRWMILISIFTRINLFAAENDIYAGNPAEGFSEEEYRIIRYLENNPIDPRDADIEDLMNIPGFSRVLAERVVKAVNKAGNYKRWVLFLSPRDRRRIYKYRELLILPLSSGSDFALRYTRSYFPNIVNCREDGHVRIENSLAGLNWRIRRDANIQEATAYAKFNMPNRQLSVHAGDFLPDFAMGLVASGRSFYYPFSYGYPLSKYRWINKGTNFYGNATRGFAAGYKRECFRVLIYNGIVREYDDGKFDFGDYVSRGGRVEAEIGESRFGLSIVEDKGSVSSVNTAFDSRLKSGNLDLGFELALSPKGGRAFSCAGKMKNKKTKSGFILYRVNRLFSNSMGRVPADGRKITGEQGGMVAVVERKISRELHLRCSVERWVNRRSYYAADKLSFNIQINRKFNRKKLRIEWKHSEYEREIFVQERKRNISNPNELKLLFTCRGGEHTQFRNSLSIPWSEDYSGCMIAPSMAFSLLDGHFKGDISLACYKAIEGAPSYYYYQPSAEGNFAWKQVSGSGFRGTIGFKVYSGRTLFHMIFSVDSLDRTDMIFQAIMKL